MTTSKEKKLDPRYLVFIDHYITALFDGVKKPEKIAAEKCGLEQSGILHKPGVYEEIVRRIEEYKSLTDIHKIKVIVELNKIAYSSIADVLDFNGTNLKT